MFFTPIMLPVFSSNNYILKFICFEMTRLGACLIVTSSLDVEHMADDLMDKQI